MVQEQIDIRKMNEELTHLKNRINEMEIAIAKERKENVLMETFGILKGKIKEDSQKMKDRLRKELYNDY